MRKVWEKKGYKKSWENHEKVIRKSWENQEKFIRKPSQFQKKVMRNSAVNKWETQISLKLKS